MASNDQSDNLIMYYFILLSALVIGYYISKNIRCNAASMFKLYTSFFLTMAGFNMQPTSLPIAAMLSGTGMGIGLHNLANMLGCFRCDDNNDGSRNSSTSDVSLPQNRV